MSACPLLLLGIAIWATKYKMLLHLLLILDCFVVFVATLIIFEIT